MENSDYSNFEQGESCEDPTIYHFPLLKPTVTNHVTSIVARVIGNSQYLSSLVPQWVDRITERSLNDVKSLSKAFKYVVVATVMEISDEPGMHVGVSGYWEPKSEECCVVRWENGHVGVVVTVTGFSM